MLAIVGFMDEDHSGEVDVKEFAASLRAARRGHVADEAVAGLMTRLDNELRLKHMKISDLFSRFDSSGDGMLSTAELRDGISLLCDVNPEAVAERRRLANDLRRVRWRKKQEARDNAHGWLERAAALPPDVLGEREFYRRDVKTPARFERMVRDDIRHEPEAAEHAAAAAAAAKQPLHRVASPWSDPRIVALAALFERVEVGGGSNLAERSKLLRALHRDKTAREAISTTRNAKRELLKEAAEAHRTGVAAKGSMTMDSWLRLTTAPLARKRTDRTLEAAKAVSLFRRGLRHEAPETAEADAPVPMVAAAEKWEWNTGNKAGADEGIDEGAEAADSSAAHLASADKAASKATDALLDNLDDIGRGDMAALQQFKDEAKHMPNLHALRRGRLTSLQYNIKDEGDVMNKMLVREEKTLPLPLLLLQKPRCYYYHRPTTALLLVLLVLPTHALPLQVRMRRQSMQMKKL